MEARMRFRSRFAHAVPVGLFVALFALMLAGCGNKNLILRIDLLSFLSPAETQAHYGPIPGGISDSLTITSRSIDLLPGVSDITSVTSVSVDAAGVFVNATGSGTGQVKIFVSANGTDPFTNDPTPIVIPVTLAAARTDTVSVTIAGDDQLAKLFLSKKAALGIRVRLDSALGPPLEGDFRLITLRAIVTARQDIVH
jgi:hypothetical protein